MLHGSLAFAHDEIFDLPMEQLLEIDLEVWAVSRSNQKPDNAPATVIIIDQDKIESRGYRDLFDVLMDLPGFDIVGSAGRFGEYYSIRGVPGNDRFLVLIDGHRVNPDQGTFLSIGHSLSIRYVKQVEVVYGPSSVTFGADAFSAVINIVSQDQPLEEDVSSAYIGLGDQSTQDVAIMVNKVFESERGAISLSARSYKSDGIDLTSRDEIYNEVVNFSQPVDDHTLNFRLNYRRFELGYFQQAFSEGNGLAHNPAIYEMGSDNLWKLKTSMLWSSYKWKMTERAGLNFDVSYSQHVQDPNTLFKKNPIQYFTGEDKTIKSNVVFTYEFERGGDFIAGLELAKAESIPPYANDEVFGTGNSVKFEGNNANIIKRELTLKENRTAAFFQLTLPIRDKLFATVGLRHDNSNQNSGSTNPRGGLVYRPAKDTTVKLLYGTAFQSPSLFDQYEQFIITDADVIMLPNTGLDNQKMKSYEVSLKKNITKNYIFNASVYLNDLSNLIFRQELEETHGIYSTVLQNTNVGSQKSRGVDLRLDGHINKVISGFLYYSYIDSAYTLNSIERDLPRISRHKLGMGLNAAISTNLEVAIQTRWLGSITTANTNERFINQGTQPGYTLFDAHISYRIADSTRFFSRFENLLNKDVEHGGLFGQSGAYAPTVYQPKFKFMIGVEVSL